nr:MAG TPA: hypothetical protein [Caudoviricetes sp.]
MMTTYFVAFIITETAPVALCYYVSTSRLKHIFVKIILYYY